MGLNITAAMIKDDPIVQNLDSMQRYYFVHIYHAICDNENNVHMRSEYGYSFAKSVKYINIYGVQLHPEKSHKFGKSLLENFSRTA